MINQFVISRGRVIEVWTFSPGTPGLLNLWRLVSSNSRPRSKSYVQTPQPFFIFFLRSDQDSLHIDQALKPTLRRPFLLSISFSKRNYLPQTFTSVFKDWTLVFHWKDLTLLVKFSHPNKARFQIPPGTGNGQMTVGCLERRGVV